MVEATALSAPQTGKRSGAIHVGGRSVSLERIHADLTWSVQVIPRFCVQRRHVAAGAFAFASEQNLATHSGGLIVTSPWRSRRGDSQLIELQCGEFRRDQVWHPTHIERAVFYSERILYWIVKPGIKICTGTTHFRDTHVSIPVGHRAKTGPGMQVHASQTVGRGNQSACTFSVRPQSLSVFSQFRVKAPGTPGRKHRPQSIRIHSQQICKVLKVWSQGNDRPNIQVSIRPRIQPVPNPRCQRVVHRGVAKGALNSDTSQSSLIIEEAGYSNDGV